MVGAGGTALGIRCRNVVRFKSRNLAVGRDSSGTVIPTADSWMPVMRSELGQSNSKTTVEMTTAIFVNARVRV